MYIPLSILYLLTRDHPNHAVAGEIDTIEILAGRDIHTVIDEIKAKATQKAVDAGADPASTRVVEVANIPVQVSRFRIFTNIGKRRFVDK